MYENNSTSHVFRFLQLRPPTAVTADGAIALSAEAPFAVKLIASAPAKRVAMARSHVSQVLAAIESMTKTAWAQTVLTAVDAVLAEEATVAEFRAAVADALRDVDTARASVQLSDMLLASKFAGGSTIGVVSIAARLFSTLDVLRSDSAADAQAKLAPVLRRPMILPHALGSPETRGTRRAEQPAPSHASAIVTRTGDWQAQVERTIHELLSLYQAQAARDIAQRRQASAKTSPQPIPQVLEPSAAARISATAQSVLRALGIDTTTRSIFAVLVELEAALTFAARNAGTATALELPPAAGPSVSALSSLTEAQVRASGIADLLIVKQHLLSYQRTDIAHVENVMSKEKRERKHRLLERSEQTFITEREQTDTKENELQTAERFELQQETQETIQRDQQVGFGLTVSGKYGPSVEFSSNVEAEASQSSEESTRSALTYAKDVMERSLQRVTQRVREEQIRKIVRESEETNTHAFDNTGATHVVGSYQFLEKEYECQIFNYGIREMFDFMVPEPASYIWHLEQSPGSDLALPPAPPKLKDFAASAEAIHIGNYRQLAAAMGTRGVGPPPPLTKYAAVSLKHGDTGDEGGRPQSVMDKEIGIPEGYVPWAATARPVALTDDDLSLAITIGTETAVWSPRGAAVQDLDGLDLATTPLTFVIATSLSSLYDSQNKLQLHVVAYESNTYAVVAEVMFVRTDMAYAAWQIKTYDALAQSAREQQAVYDQQVADLRARARADAAAAGTQFDAPPSEHQRVVKGELKKHCLSIITQQWYSAPNGVLATDPPTFDLDVAASRGAFIRFFEQAFEWDQLQYVCYPYFWARQDTWGSRFRRSEVDPVFLDFLQAGSARVVVPVRPGFEAAVLHFLETLDATGTGEVWNGSGDPPPIASELYVSIVREIQERTNAPQGEIAVGAPWKTQLPTPLVMLRPDDSLPRWKRASPDGWDWSEVP